VEQVGGEQNGATTVGIAAQQTAHPADASGVEAVGRLVEDQDRRLPKECGRDPEPLPHAQRIVTDPARRLLRRQADQVEHLFDPPSRQAHKPLGDGEDLAAGTPCVLGRGVEQNTDLKPRVGQVHVVPSRDGDRPRHGSGQADHDPHGGRLPSPVRAEEAGDPTRLCGEADVIDGGEGAVGLGDPVDGDHRSSTIPAVMWEGLKPLTMR
jgi:hypothetical protein